MTKKQDLEISNKIIEDYAGEVFPTDFAKLSGKFNISVPRRFSNLLTNLVILLANIFSPLISENLQQHP